MFCCKGTTNLMCAFFFFNISKALICQQIIFSFIFVVSIIFSEIQETEP